MKLVKSTMSLRPIVNEQCRVEIYNSALQSDSTGPISGMMEGISLDLHHIQRGFHLLINVYETYYIIGMLHPLNFMGVLRCRRRIISSPQSRHVTVLCVVEELNWHLRCSSVSSDSLTVNNLKYNRRFVLEWQEHKRTSHHLFLFLYIHTTLDNNVHKAEYCQSNRVRELCESLK